MPYPPFPSPALQAHGEVTANIGKIRSIRYDPPMAQPPAPSLRKLAGIAIILLLIVFWAAFVASLAPLVGQWPILVQAPYYLIMGTIWIIPLKPLIRWSESGHFRAPPE
ncbi:MAG: DUF2842 domain-containing protein [Sphingomicrobium sp.]